MPLPVLQAVGRDGEVTAATAAEDSTQDLEALRTAGIDLDHVTQQLPREGVDAFIVRMKKLLAASRPADAH